jgi:hypothetical protein
VAAPPRLEEEASSGEESGVGAIYMTGFFFGSLSVPADDCLVVVGVGGVS